MMKGKAVLSAVFLAFCLTACGAAGRTVSQSDEVLAKEEAVSDGRMAHGGQIPENAVSEAGRREGTAAEEAERKGEKPSEVSLEDPVTKEPGQKSVKIGLLAEISQGDESAFNQKAWSGLKKAEQELGIRILRLDSATEADYAANLEAFVSERYDLVITSGQVVSKELLEASGKTSRTKLAVLDWNGNPDRISGEQHMMIVRFDPSQAAYLAGITAGMITRNNKVGWIVGDENARTATSGYSYLAGVLDANPKAVILQENIHSFQDKELGREAACRMAQEGADVLFSVAGSAGTGVIQGCGQSQIKAIGTDPDQSAAAADTVAASIVKQTEQAVLDVARSCAEGRLEGSVLTYDLRNEGCDFLPSDDILSEEVLTTLQTVKEKLKSGQITVPDTKETFEAAYGDVYLLD